MQIKVLKDEKGYTIQIPYTSKGNILIVLLLST